MPRSRLTIFAVLACLVGACIEPPPYPKIIPRADADTDTAAKVEVDTSPDIKPDADTVAEVDADTAAEVDADTVAEIDADTVAEVDADTAAEVDSDTAAEVDADTAAQVDADAPAEVDAGTAAEIDVDTPAEVDADTTPDIEVDTATDTDTDTDTGPDVVPPCLTAADCAPSGPCQGPPSCDPFGAGCTYEALTGTPCDDGDPCTVPDLCEAGVCKTGPKDCSASDGTCLVGACNPLDGFCEPIPAPDGAPCDDGKPCTLGDTCKAIKCGGVAKSCEDFNPCTADSCDSKTGACSHTVAADGTVCDDGDDCTAADTCNSGQCVAVGKDETITNWELSLSPAPFNNKIKHGRRQDGGVQVVAEMDAPAMLTHAGGSQEFSPPTSPSAGQFVSGLWLFGFSKSGLLEGYRPVGGSEKIRLLDLVVTPLGGMFVLVQRSGTLVIPVTEVNLEAPESGSATSLLYFPLGGDFGWVLTFPSALEPVTLWYDSGPSPWINVIATHAVAATQPVVSGTPPASLPAAQSTTRALALMSWALDGSSARAADIGWLSEAALESRVVARGAPDHRFKVGIGLEGPGFLNVAGLTPLTPSGESAALFGSFSPSGLGQSYATADSPTMVALAVLDFDAVQGGVATVVYSNAMTFIDGSGAQTDVTAGEPVLGHPPGCLFRTDSAGELMWPLNCSNSGGFVVPRLSADGAVFAVGSAWDLSAPNGTTYRLSSDIAIQGRFAAKLSPQGELLSLALPEGLNTCFNFGVDPSGAYTCEGWKYSEGEPKVIEYFLRSLASVPAVGCGD